MLRILGLVLAFYIVGLTVVDAVTFGGRYRTIVWQEANNRAYRVSMEVQYLLDKAGVWARAANVTAPSHADVRR
jgi:hypothetical protein